MAKKSKCKNCIIFGIVVFVILGLLYTQTSIFQTALDSYDFTHYIMLDGQEKDGLFFGTSQFTVSIPQYSSDCDQDIKTNAPSPNTECWTATATFEGQQYTLPYGEDVVINDWLTVKWETDALVDNGELEDYDRTDKLYVKFYPDEAIQFTPSVSDMTLLGTDVVINLEITNNMPTINTVIEVKKESRLFSLVDTFAGENIYETDETSIHAGISEQQVTANIPTLGQYSLLISLIPVISYSEGDYKESTSSQRIFTTVVSEPVYSGQVPVEEETEGKAIPVFDSISSQLQKSVTTADYIMYGIIVLLSIILIYLGYKVYKKYR